MHLKQFQIMCSWRRENLWKEESAWQVLDLSVGVRQLAGMLWNVPDPPTGV